VVVDAVATQLFPELAKVADKPVVSAVEAENELGRTAYRSLRFVDVAGTRIADDSENSPGAYAKVT